MLRIPSRLVTLAPSRSTRALALLGAALSAPLAARAQGAATNASGDVQIFGRTTVSKSAYYSTSPTTYNALDVASNGTRSAIYTDRASGKAGVHFVAAGGGNNANGSAIAWTTIRVQRRTTEFLMPIDFYVDGLFIHPGKLEQWQSPFAEVKGSFSAGSQSFDWLVKMDRTTAGEEREALSRTFWVTIPGATSGAQVFDVRLGMSMRGQAANGAVADFSHTMAMYVPQIAGQSWEAVGGTLTRQSRPAWATTRHPGEIVTTPEPGTLLLLAGGLVTLVGGTVVRRRHPVA